MSEVETYFLVAVNKDSTLATYAELPEEGIGRERPANNYDVYQAAKQIVDEFEQTMFANKVAQIVISSLAPASEPVPDKVKEKLKERGIKPDNSPHHP
jgi:hypothetical protein